MLTSTVTTIIETTYGRSTMSQGLAQCLIEKIPEWDSDDRERQIMLTCWNWFSGGSTAENVAHKIKMALFEEERAH